MPNHITNVLKIEAMNIEALKDFVKQYRTQHKAEVGRSYDGRLRYTKPDEDIPWGLAGFLEESTGKFKYRYREELEDGTYEWHDIETMGIPEGFEVDITEAYMQFPDFNKVIPQPDNIFRGNLGQKEKEQCAKEGRPTWYEWNTENWGTKWNSYDCSKVKDVHNNGHYCLIYQFDTAWSPVRGIIDKMMEDNPNIKLTYTYADEDRGYNTGQIRYENGMRVNENYPMGGSEEANELYFETRPSAKEDYVLVDKEYIHKEDLEEEND